MCPRYNGVIGDISNGQNVRYLCDTHALVYDKVNLKRGSTVRDCALHCLATPGCLSSMFKAADNVCFVSNQTQATARVPGFVYMLLEKRGTDSGPQPQLGCEEEKKRIQDCERNLKDTQDKLDKLQGQPGQHDPRTPDCDSWRDACIRPCDRSNLAVHGIEYEKRCLAKPRNTIFYQTNTHKSPTECLAKECSGKSDCIGIQWVKTNGVSLLLYNPSN